MLRLRPGAYLERRRIELREFVARLQRAVLERLRERRQALTEAQTRLALLSPQHTLERGYSITFDQATGIPAHDPAKLAPGTKLRTLLAKGEVRSVVEPNP